MINKNTGDTISFTDIKNEFGMPPGKNLGAYRISQSVGGLSNLGLDNDDDTGQSHRPPTSSIPQSGTIRFSDFYQKRLNVVVDYSSNGWSGTWADSDSGAGNDGTLRKSFKVAARTDSSTGTLYAQQVQVSGDA